MSTMCSAGSSFFLVDRMKIISFSIHHILHLIILLVVMVAFLYREQSQVQGFVPAIPAATSSITCGSNNFCIGMRNNLPHCYGKTDGCLWGAKDCTKDADCSKYTEASPAYTDSRPCDSFKLGDWPYDACPAAEANFDVRVAPNQPSTSYQDLKRVCENKGKKLCRSNDICNKSRQVSMAGLTSAFTNDNWIAVGDKDNEWLTLNRGGDQYCKTHTEVAGSVPAWGTSAEPGNWERLAKCCPT